MSQSSTLTQSTAAQAVHVEVTSDRLSARMTVDPTAEVGVADVMAAVEKAGLSPLENLRATLDTLLDASGHVAAGAPIVVATGTAAVDDTPARVEQLAGAPAGEQTGSFYERSHIVSVAVDQPVARFVPRQLGKDGIDCYGHPLRRRPAPDLRPQLGTNVRLADDGQTIVATAPGKPRVDGMKVSVEPVLAIPGNIDFSTGNVSFAGDLTIRAGVLDLFRVSATGSIHVGGSIEAAEVSAGHDLIVDGAILNKGKGRCTAGGTMRCRHATNSNLTAGGDVVAGSELADCTVVAGGRVVVERGAILAGHVTATGGVACQSLGSASGAKTTVEIGADPALRGDCAAKVVEIEATRAKARQVRETIAPLLQRQKSLTAQQKERATELLYEADERETAATQMLADLRKRYDDYCARAKPQLEVTKVIHAGVVLRFPHCEAHVTQDILGDARVIEKQTSHGWQVFVVRPKTNALVPLASRPVKDDAMAALIRVMQKHD